MNTVRPKHSDFFNYPFAPEGLIVYEFTGSACTASLTPKTVYVAEDGKIYNNPNQTSPYTGNFFLSDDKAKSYYYNVTNGVIGDAVNNLCEAAVPSVIRWKDLGMPTAISTFNDTVLAAYASLHIVVKYNFANNEKNPIGTIVAGEYLKQKKSIQTGGNYLNTPILVQWRSDGQRFAVFSGGVHKSMCVYDFTGSLLWSTDENYAGNSVSGWDFNIVNGYSSTVRSTVGPDHLISRLSGNMTDLNLNWVATKLEFPVDPTFNGDSVFILIQRKTSNTLNNFVSYESQVYTVSKNWVTQTTFPIFNNSFKYDVPVNAPTAESRLFSSDDMITDIAVQRVKFVNSSTAAYELSIVTPRSPATGGNDQYTRVRVDTYMIEHNYLDSSSSGVKTKEEVVNFTPSNRLLTKHVRAYCSYIGDKLFITVKSSPVSYWERFFIFMDYFMKYGAAATGLVIVSGLVVGIGGVGPTTGIATILGLTMANPAGLIVLAVVAVAVGVYFLFKERPKTIDNALGRLVYAGTIENPTITFGRIANSADWMDNDLSLPNISYVAGSSNNPRFLYMDVKHSGEKVSSAELFNVRLSNLSPVSYSDKITTI